MGIITETASLRKMDLSPKKQNNKKKVTNTHSFSVSKNALCAGFDCPLLLQRPAGNAPFLFLSLSLPHQHTHTLTVNIQQF
jgi:hypothetical protein